MFRQQSPGAGDDALHPTPTAFRLQLGRGNWRRKTDARRNVWFLAGDELPDDLGELGNAPAVDGMLAQVRQWMAGKTLH